MRYVSILLVLALSLAAIFTGCEKDKEVEAAATIDSSSSYPFEDDNNTPEYDNSLPEVPYPGGTEGDTGENGDTWDLPEWGTDRPDYDPDNDYIPDIPQW